MIYQLVKGLSKLTTTSQRMGVSSVNIRIGREIKFM